VDGATATFEVFEGLFACADGFEVVSDEGVCVRGSVRERGGEVGKELLAWTGSTA
jgi:hypothetical protein